MLTKGLCGMDSLGIEANATLLQILPLTLIHLLLLFDLAHTHTLGHTTLAMHPGAD